MALKTASQQQFVSAREHFRQLITNKGKPADPSLGARLGKTELTLNLISRWVVAGRGGAECSRAEGECEEMRCSDCSDI